MNLSQQTIRNMTTDELLNAAECLESIDRLTFSYISEKVSQDFQDIQDDLVSMTEARDEVEEEVDFAALSLRKIRELSDEILEDENQNDPEKLIKVLCKINSLADGAFDQIRGDL